MAAGSADKEGAALSRAQAYLACGDFKNAAAVLRPAVRSVTRTRAALVAKLLIAARLPDHAIDLAVQVASQPNKHGLE